MVAVNDVSNPAWLVCSKSGLRNGPSLCGVSVKGMDLSWEEFRKSVQQAIDIRIIIIEMTRNSD